MSDEKKNELAKAYEPAAIEEKWAKYWVEERLFDVTAPAARTKSFTTLLPPPNVTGRLHMGHMLNQTEMDLLTRWHRMRGETALWVPGTDHAGIATQMMVERQLATEGLSREGLGRTAFTDRVWKWKAEYGGAITDQMRRLGASVDWSREYFTMDAKLSAAVKEAFVRLYEEGLIYRGEYMVNWDPVIQTAVSDLEVVHEDRIGKLYHIRYALADGSGSITVATTRPETMLGDVAVAVNPNDERYKPMLGKMLVLPLVGREIPVIADDWANPEFGTGAVKVTPAHDPNDFAIGQRHSLPNLNILDKTAHVSLPGSPYDGLDRYAAREKIVADLQALGALVEIKDHAMSVGLSQRSGVVIEPRLSQQWFLKIQPLADKAIAAVEEGHIRFTPDMYRKTFDEWMRNIHDWCISRQLWWGHQIPAWHCGLCKAITVSRGEPVMCGVCGQRDPVQETDVLDTWFSSGLLPFTVFGWPEGQGLGIRDQGLGGQDDLTAFYPTDVLVTGFDILFFWVARMAMLGIHFMLDVPMPDGGRRSLAEAVPFREVYIHALVRDADRQKMSKTKGNVIDPIDIIARFGTDAVRFTLASMASPGTDIAFSEERTDGYRAFANKVWNAARFVLMQVERAKEAGVTVDMSGLAAALLGGAAGLEGEHPHDRRDETAPIMGHPPEVPLESRWILARLSTACSAVDAALCAYRFDEAANAVYQFFWGELCDWYLEMVKLRLDGTPESKVALTTLVAVFEAALRLLSPFMPFLTEEIWHALYEGVAPAKSIALTRYPQAIDVYADEDSVAEMELLQELIVTVRGLRKEVGVPEKEATPILVHGPHDVTRMALDSAGILAKMARGSSVSISHTGLKGTGSRSTGRFEVQVVYERVIDVAAECERLLKDLAKYEKGLTAAEKQLGNDAFIGRAPSHIVEGLKKQAAETQVLWEKTKAALAELGC